MMRSSGLWEFVTRYSGATVPDFHGVPGRLAVNWMANPSIHFKEQLLPTPLIEFCQEILTRIFFAAEIGSERSPRALLSFRVQLISGAMNHRFDRLMFPV